MGSAASTTEATASKTPPVAGAVCAHPPTGQPIMCQRHMPSAAEVSRPQQRALASSVIQLDFLVQWVTSCNDASGYRGDASDRVVPSYLASGDRSVALPKPALFAALQSKTIDHLVVASLEGTTSRRLLRCHCPIIDFQRRICGLHCHKQQLFIAQTEAITLTDLSGCVLFRIPSYVLGARKEISGIGGNASTLFVSGGGSVAAFSMTTRGQETLIDLTQLPSMDASLDMARLVATIGNKSTLVIDKSHRQVHALCTRNRQLVATYPNRLTGLDQFEWLWCVTTDARGRIFASDGDSHTVYAMAPDGSVIQTFGGDDSDHGLLCPRGFAIAESANGSREHLVVADWGHKRLVVFDL